MITADLIKESEVAARWDMTESKFAELRRKNNWPHVRLSRFDVRYTEAQLAQIVDMQTEGGSASTMPQGAARIPGQTGRSAGRKRGAALAPPAARTA